jgi:hypothetical protein
VVRCYIKAIKGLLSSSACYELHIESNDQLLAVARKRKKTTSSCYLISMGSNGAAVTRSDEQLVGKVCQPVLRFRAGACNNQCPCMMLQRFIIRRKE